VSCGWKRDIDFKIEMVLNKTYLEKTVASLKERKRK
jgi:hypothetical protein